MLEWLFKCYIIKGYRVCFETIDHEEIHKMIILPIGRISNVEEFVRTRFNSVAKVVMVESLDACLILQSKWSLFLYY